MTEHLHFVWYWYTCSIRYLDYLLLLEIMLVFIQIRLLQNPITTDLQLKVFVKQKENAILSCKLVYHQCKLGFNHYQT